MHTIYLEHYASLEFCHGGLLKVETEKVPIAKSYFKKPAYPLRGGSLTARVAAGVWHRPSRGLLEDAEAANTHLK